MNRRKKVIFLYFLYIYISQKALEHWPNIGVEVGPSYALKGCNYDILSFSSNAWPMLSKWPMLANIGPMSAMLQYAGITLAS
jgi:hypothetical protein